MNADFQRDSPVREELAALALEGDLDAACLLGVIEAPYAAFSDLDANPAAAAVYRLARAAERQRLDAEWDALADQVAAALL